MVQQRKTARAVRSTSDRNSSEKLATRKKSARKPEKSTAAPSASAGIGSLLGSLGELTSDLTLSALKIASRTRDNAARAISRSPDQLRLMAAAGDSLRDLREVAGLTVTELSDALNLRDKSLLEAVEDGREALSFELILRLASLVARNDPLPFILKYTRSYNPRLWEILHELKIDQLPLQFERERSFINIYRRHDAARKLSDTGFTRVLDFTQNAFDMAIHFVAETEKIESAESAKKGAKTRKPQATRRRAAPAAPTRNRRR